MNYDQISILDILMIKKQLEKMPMTLQAWRCG